MLPQQGGRSSRTIQGWKVVHITAYDISRLPKIEGEIERLRQAYGIPRSHVIVDEDGVGGGVVNHLPGIKGFVSGSSPIIDPERQQAYETETGQKYQLNYKNLKTQCYYFLADKVAAHGVAVPCASPEEQELIREDLEQVKGRNIDGEGKVQVVGKEEVKANLGRSPDYGDCLMMRAYFDLEPQGPSFYFGVVGEE